jgi:hypothetical protein
MNLNDPECAFGRDDVRVNSGASGPPPAFLCSVKANAGRPAAATFAF